MTEREQFDLDETRRIVGARDGWQCRYCGCTDSARLQLAHRVPKDKRYVERWGKRVIHHPHNLVMTCDLCNGKAEVDPKTRPLEAEMIIAEIQDMIAGPAVTEEGNV